MTAVSAQLPLPPKAVRLFSGPARYRCLYGGRGSGKTQAFALMAAVDGYRLGRAGISGLMLCAREHLVNLDESSMKEVKEAIQRVSWLADYYEIGEKYIRSRDRRIDFSFVGLRHNIQGVKSKAKILRFWLDEAEDASELALQTVIPTVRAEGPWGQSEIWCSWNPGSANSAVHKRFRENTPEDCRIEEMNWRDNPWFPKVLNRARLDDMQRRPETYQHVWEGQFLSISEALIFSEKYEIDLFEPASDWDGPYHGLDFGFSQDPTAASQSYIYNNCLYIRHSFAKKKLELDETASAVATAIPRFAMYAVRADNSRPESISFLRQNGIPRIESVKKWPGSIEDGIEFMKSFDRIIIHPDAKDAAEEFSLYSYKVDRQSGDILPVILDANNHVIDSIRYALAPMIKMRGQPRIRAL